MVTLDSARLGIRAWEERDAAFVFDMYSRWDVQRFLGHAPAFMQTLDEAEQLLETGFGKLTPRSSATGRSS